MLDWKAAIFALQTVTVLVTITSFFTLKFNDMRHLAKAVESLKGDVKDVSLKVMEMSEAQVKMTAICDTRHNTSE